MLRSLIAATVSLILPLDAAKPPNIVFFLFDDMGYGEPKCYREDTKLKTPNIDRLAAEGMRFTDLMNKVITDGRSTAGAPQQNDSHVSLGKAATVKPNNESKDN